MKARKCKRDICIKTYISSDEKLILDELMSIHNMTQAELIRWSIFNKEISLNVRNDKYYEEIKTVITEFSKIGVNLNQIAAHLNSGGAATENINSDITAAISSLSDLSNRLLHIYKESQHGNSKTFIKS